MRGFLPRWFPRRGAVASAAAIVLVAGGSLLNTPVASAHAEIRSVVPAPHAVVAEAPKLVVTYSEAVAGGAPDVVVRGPADFAWRAPFPPDSATVSVALPALRAGSYVAAWTTKAEDGHVQLAATSFAVGAPTRVRIADPAIAAASVATTTTVPPKTTTRKGAKKAPATTRKAGPTSTVIAGRTAAELPARTDANEVAATLRVSVLADSRVSIAVAFPAGAKAVDSVALSAASSSTNGGAIPIVVKPAATSAMTSEPAVLPPGEWTLRLSVTRGFDQQDATAALTLAAA